MSLLATLMLIKAEALDALGRTAEAEALRVDSQQWARYGFGAESADAGPQREIAALGRAADSAAEGAILPPGCPRRELGTGNDRHRRLSSGGRSSGSCGATAGRPAADIAQYAAATPFSSG
jgi:hypothetical protein